MRLMPLLKHELPAEIQRWEQAGIIEAAQSQRILSFYGIEKQHLHSRSLGLQVLSALGGLFLVLAVILIVGKNWEQIPASLRIAGLCTVTLLMNISGFFALQKGRSSAAHLLLFLGAGMYGACIFLISQIFHLSGSLPMALWGWALGVIPLAFATGCLRFTLLAQGLLLPYVFWYNSQEAEPLLYLPLGLALWVTVIQQGSKTAFLLQLICSLVVVNRLIPSEWLGGDLAPHTFFTVGIGLLLYLGAVHLEASKKNSLQEFALLTQLWAFRLALVVLFVLAEKGVLKEFIRDLAHKPFPALIIGIATISLSGLLSYLHPERWKVLFRPSSIPLLACLIIPLIGILCTSLGTDASTVATLRIVVDAALITCGLRFVVQGRNEMRNGLIVLGALILSVLALLRYVDLVGDYLGTALLFALEGALLLGLGYKLSKSTQKSEVV